MCCIILQVKVIRNEFPVFSITSIDCNKMPIDYELCKTRLCTKKKKKALTKQRLEGQIKT
jgi:hypothetical protein